MSKATKQMNNWVAKLVIFGIINNTTWSLSLSLSLSFVILMNGLILFLSNGNFCYLWWCVLILWLILRLFWALKLGQSLATKLIVVLGYKLTQYLFIGGKFWQIHHWITFSSYILHVCKISRKLNINSYVINKFLNCKFL